MSTVKSIAVLIFLTFLTGQNSYSQSFAIKVMDAENNNALPFASISIKNSNIGTVSNSEGYFVLSENGLNASDTILISYLGYKRAEITIEELKGMKVVNLIPDNIDLAEVRIYSRDLSARDIIEKVKENFDTNHPLPQQKRRIFIHNYTNTPFSDKNRFIVKKSEFETFNQEIAKDLFDMMPDEFTDYSDAIVDLYSYNEIHKLIPDQAISLEESGQSEIIELVEERLKGFTEEIRESIKDDDIYYKFKTGIIGTKVDLEESEDSESEENENGEKKMTFRVPTSALRYELLQLISDYSDLEGDNLEFITKPGKYNYELLGLEYLNNEPVFKIEFKPGSGGLYEGLMYVSNSSFAILQMEFSFSEGKSDKKFQLFGIGHAIRMKKALVINEKYGDAFYVKYLNIYEKEYASFERPFSILKKKRRFLIDKTLKEVKMRADIFLDINQNYEILVMDREDISQNKIESLKEDRYIDFKKETRFSDELWKDKTLIRPDSALINYQRRDN